MASRPRNHGALAVLAACAVYFAIDQSAADRNAFDWTVIGLLGCAVLWNLLQLGRQLRGRGERNAA